MQPVKKLDSLIRRVIAVKEATLSYQLIANGWNRRSFRSMLLIESRFPVGSSCRVLGIPEFPQEAFYSCLTKETLNRSTAANKHPAARRRGGLRNCIFLLNVYSRQRLDDEGAYILFDSRFALGKLFFDGLLVASSMSPSQLDPKTVLKQY
ncbi:hypothetical protein WN48_08241 [Eufriesea mexicana]|nr:hypothetical protein WN48_08241 [Eufriesea mexicana]